MQTQLLILACQVHQLSNMIYCFRLLSVIILSLACLGVNAQPTSSIEKINYYVALGKCADAEALTRTTISGPAMQTSLGIISLDCRKSSSQAVGYFQIAASQGETVAIEYLNSMGIPFASPRPRVMENFIPLPVQSPPPHVFSPAPQPKEINIIAIQPQVVFPPVIYQGSNMGACIQDGGPIFCPNHPNNRIIPLSPYGR